MKRMDRYRIKEDILENTSRLELNKDLYSEIRTNQIYVDVSNDIKNAIEVTPNNKSKIRTREYYQRVKEYQDVLTIPKEEIPVFVEQNTSPKNYDINAVITEAKKNRQEKNELERKRNLQNTEYNILASLNKEELAKFREERRNTTLATETEEIQELINTITAMPSISSTTKLSLMDDLMSTALINQESSSTPKPNLENEMHTDISNNKEEIKKDQLIVEEIKANTSKDISNIDKSFYTKSMELDPKDFEKDESMSINNSKKPKRNIALKITLFILIILVITFSIYYFVKVK